MSCRYSRNNFVSWITSGFHYLLLIFVTDSGLPAVQFFSGLVGTWCANIRDVGRTGTNTVMYECSRSCC